MFWGRESLRVGADRISLVFWRHHGIRVFMLEKFSNTGPATILLRKFYPDGIPAVPGTTDPPKHTSGHGQKAYIEGKKHIKLGGPSPPRVPPGTLKIPIELILATNWSTIYEPEIKATKLRKKLVKGHYRTFLGGHQSLHLRSGPPVI